MAPPRAIATTICNALAADRLSTGLHAINARMVTTATTAVMTAVAARILKIMCGATAVSVSAVGIDACRHRSGARLIRSKVERLLSEACSNGLGTITRKAVKRDT